MTAPTIGGTKLRETIEHLIDKLVDNKLIPGFTSGQDKQAVIDQVIGALEQLQLDNNVSAALFSNPLQLKKMLSLIVCATLENNYKKDPAFANVIGMFNTKEMALALFSPDMDPAQAKKSIFNLMMTLTPPGPGQRKKCEELAELIVQQKRSLSEEERQDLQLDKTAEDALTALLKNYLYEQKEYAFMQAFGAPPDGTPIANMGAQLGNTIGASDMYAEKAGDGGYLKMANDPTNVNTSGEVKSTIELKKMDLGILDAFYDELVSMKIAPKMRMDGPRPPISS